MYRVVKTIAPACGTSSLGMGVADPWAGSTDARPAIVRVIVTAGSGPNQIEWKATAARPAAAKGAGVEGAADFEQFVREHLPVLLRFGSALTGSPHDGADLVQIALEKAGVHWNRVQAADSPLAYVKAIMANTRISLWRRRRHESLLPDLPERSMVDVYPVDNSGLWDAVASLPQRQRAVIVLRYLDGHSEQEIASILGIAAGTVKSQASKAMASLRRAVADPKVEEV